MPPMPPASPWLTWFRQTDNSRASLCRSIWVASLPVAPTVLLSWLSMFRRNLTCEFRVSSLLQELTTRLLPFSIVQGPIAPHHRRRQPSCTAHPHSASSQEEDLVLALDRGRGSLSRFDSFVVLLTRLLLSCRRTLLPKWSTTCAARAKRSTGVP